MFNEHHWCQTLGVVRFIANSPKVQVAIYSSYMYLQIFDGTTVAVSSIVKSNHKNALIWIARYCI